MSHNITMRILASLLLIIAAMQANAANSFYCLGNYIAPGETGTLMFSLDNDRDFYGFQAEIELPEGYEFVSPDGKKVEVSFTERAGSGFSAVSNLVGERKVKLGAFSSSHTPISGNSGPLLGIKVRAAGNFSSGYVNVSQVLFTAESGSDVSFPDASTEIRFVPATDVLLSASELKLNIGNRYQLDCSIMPENSSDKVVVWDSSDKNVAEVDAKGCVTALAYGETTIVATAGNATANCRVEVVPVEATSVSLSRSELVMKPKEKFTLEATILPDNTYDKTVVWTSSDESVATVDRGGRVTARAVGTATITASCGNVSATCNVTVEPIPVSLIVLSQTAVEIEQSQTVHLNAVAFPETASDKSLTWASSDESVVTVDQTGIVTAISVGVASVSVSSASGISAKCEVTVVPPKVIPAEAVVLNKTAVELRATESFQLEATVMPETTTDKTVTWKSSNDAVATVDATGQVTAISIGKANITATAASGVSATCEVTVVATPAASVTLNRSELSLRATESFRLEATVMPETTTDKTVTWKSSNDAVATVDATGQVTAISIGKANITATAASGVSATCEVTVVATPAASVTLNRSELSLRATESFRLEATVMPETTTDKTVTWASSNDAVATVDATGNVTAVAIGKAVVTATCGDVSAICNVTVVSTDAGSISLNETAVELRATENFQLEATVMPETATDKTVTWKSSNDAVATVDAAGKVTAISVGKANITATAASGVSATCEVTVVVTPAASVTLNRSELSLRATESFQLEATVMPETATDKTVTWKSSNDAVATVDASGTVTAVAIGNAVVTATCGDVSATCNVTVVSTDAGSISLNETAVELRATESFRLEATVMPETTTDKTVTWKSSNDAVATVDATGNVTAISVGKANITATAASGVSATCEVTVVATPAASVTLNRSELSLRATESFQLEATVMPETTTDKTVTWKSSNDAVATVDATGKVIAVAIGNAVVTATCGDVSATCNVTVVSTDAGSISLNKTAVELRATESFQLEATVMPETATDKTVTWASSNDAVATVDAAGNVTAISVGKANITATAASGVSATCEVTVVATPAASVTLNRSELSLRATESFQLEATVMPETTTDKTVIWASSNESVATVDATGKVIAIAIGNAVVTATCGDVSATCEVTVVATPAESITLNCHDLNLDKNDWATLTAIISPEDATYTDIEWASSNEDVATVDNAGVVTAVSEGTAIIRVFIVDTPSVYDECIVTVREESGIDEVVGDVRPYKIYNLKGVFVSDSYRNLAPGCYILRDGTTVRKIVVK